jgi:hypothetical protein
MHVLLQFSSIDTDQSTVSCENLPANISPASLPFAVFTKKDFSFRSTLVVILNVLENLRLFMSSFLIHNEEILRQVINMERDMDRTRCYREILYSLRRGP